MEKRNKNRNSTPKKLTSNDKNTTVTQTVNPEAQCRNEGKGTPQRIFTKLKMSANQIKRQIYVTSKSKTSNSKIKPRTHRRQKYQTPRSLDMEDRKQAAKKNVRTHMLQLEDPLKRNNNNKMYERAKKTRVKQLA